MAFWTAKKEEELFIVLKDFRNLWCREDKGFLNSTQRYTSLSEISKILGIPTADINKKILSIENDILFEINSHKRDGSSNELLFKDDESCDYLYQELLSREYKQSKSGENRNEVLFDLVIQHDCLLKPLVTKAEKDVAKNAWIQVAEEYKDRLNLPYLGVVSENHVRKKFYCFLKRISKKMERFLSGMKTKKLLPSDYPTEFEKSVVKYFPRVLLNAQMILKECVGDSTDKQVVFSEPIDYSCLNNEDDDDLNDNLLDIAVMDEPSNILPDDAMADETSNNSTSCSSYFTSSLPTAADGGDMLNLGEYDDVGYQVIDLETNTSFELTEEDIDAMEIKSFITGLAPNISSCRNPKLSLFLTKVLSRQAYVDIVDNSLILDESPAREVFNVGFWKMISSEFADSGFKMMSPLNLKSRWDEIMSLTRVYQERFGNGEQNERMDLSLFWYTLLTFPLLFTADVIFQAEDKDATSQNCAVLQNMNESSQGSQEFILPDEEYVSIQDVDNGSSSNDWTNKKHVEANTTIKSVRHPKPVILPDRAEVMEMNKRLQTASVPPTIASKNNVVEKTNRIVNQSNSKMLADKQKITKPSLWVPNRKLLQMPAWMTRPRNIMKTLTPEPVQVFETKKTFFTEKDETEAYNHFLEVLRNVPTSDVNPIADEPPSVPSGKSKPAKKDKIKEPKEAKKRGRRRKVEEETTNDNSSCSEDVTSQISDESQSSINCYLFEDLPKRTAKYTRRKRNKISDDTPQVQIAPNTVESMPVEQNRAKSNPVITLDMTDPYRVVMTTSLNNVTVLDFGNSKSEKLLRSHDGDAVNIPQVTVLDSANPEDVNSSKLKQLLESSNIGVENIPQLTVLDSSNTQNTCDLVESSNISIENIPQPTVLESSNSDLVDTSTNSIPQLTVLDSANIQETSDLVESSNISIENIPQLTVLDSSNIQVTSDLVDTSTNSIPQLTVLDSANTQDTSDLVESSNISTENTPQLTVLESANPQDIYDSKLKQLLESSNIDIENIPQLTVSDLDNPQDVSGSRLRQLLESSNISIENIPQLTILDSIDPQDIPMLSIPDNIDPQELASLISRSSVTNLPPLIAIGSDDPSVTTSTLVSPSEDAAVAMNIQVLSQDGVPVTSDLQNSAIVGDDNGSSLQPFDTSVLEESAKSCNIDLRSYYSMIADCLDDSVANEDDNAPNTNPSEENHSTTDISVNDGVIVDKCLVKVLKTPKNIRLIGSAADLKTYHANLPKYVKIAPKIVGKSSSKTLSPVKGIANINKPIIKTLKRLQTAPVLQCIKRKTNIVNTPVLKNISPVKGITNANKPILKVLKTISPAKRHQTTLVVKTSSPVVEEPTDGDRPVLKYHPNLLKRKNDVLNLQGMGVIRETKCNPVEKVMESLKSKGLSVKKLQNGVLNLNKIISKSKQVLPQKSKRNSTIYLIQKPGDAKVQKTNMENDVGVYSLSMGDDCSDDNIEECISLDSDDDDLQSANKNTERDCDPIITVDSDDDEPLSVHKNTDKNISINKKAKNSVTKDTDDPKSIDNDEKNAGCSVSSSKKTSDSKSVNKNANNSKSVDENMYDSTPADSSDEDDIPLSMMTKRIRTCKNKKSVSDG